MKIDRKEVPGVICDWCGADYTDRADPGGLLFSGKACCPECVPKVEAGAERYKEERFIRARCPEGKSFADWVREDLRGGRPGYIEVRTSERAYVGRRPGRGSAVVEVGWHDPDGLGRRFEPLPHMVRHSPTGMEWGYGGSGPSDLALSILAHHFGEDPLKDRDARSNGLYMRFKEEIVSRLPPEWSLLKSQIDHWLESVAKEGTVH